MQDKISMIRAKMRKQAKTKPRNKNKLKKEAKTNEIIDISAKHLSLKFGKKLVNKRITFFPFRRSS